MMNLLFRENDDSGAIESTTGGQPFPAHQHRKSLLVKQRRHEEFSCNTGGVKDGKWQPLKKGPAMEQERRIWGGKKCAGDLKH